MAIGINAKARKTVTVPKRTSIGDDRKVTNKSARRRIGKKHGYRGQGRP